VAPNFGSPHYSASAQSAAVYRSALMHAALEMAARAGRRDSKVLITGESGVGKDVVARYIHASSRRASRPFVPVNCAGLAETLLESELFGHVKGSFTGAYRDKPGKLQLAHGGTTFLDEVGEMTPRMQALLLRYLETGEVQPVGSDAPDVRADTRVVAATNRDLQKMVSQGLFREDLMYRIRVVHVHVPALRERPEDIRPLLEYSIKQVDPSLELTAAAWTALERYSWPGNVRELLNVVEQLSALGATKPIAVEQLPWCSQPAPAPAEAQGSDRRRHVADTLFERITSGPGDFWTDVCDRFMDRDLTRQDVRELISRGLDASGGSYRELLRLFRMDVQDYKRLLNFLVRHDCTVDFRAFRGRPKLARRSVQCVSTERPEADEEHPSSMAG
jgi:transcriptional regulator with PAS, ATPase and Fis domain